MTKSIESLRLILSANLGETELSESESLTQEGKTAKEKAESAEPNHAEADDVAKATTATPRKQLEVPDDVHVEIDINNLKDYVGPPIFLSDRLYDQTPPGVVMGLAWTSMGGSSLYIESILESPLAYSRGPHLNRTGQLGDVMKESSSIAYSFVKGLMTRGFSDNAFFEKAQIHLHCPEGAVPKDGMHILKELKILNL